MTMVLSRDIAELIGFLEVHEVKYVVVGGFAVNYYGYVRSTQDIDLLVVPCPDNATKVLSALKAFGFGAARIPRKAFESEGSVVHLGVEPNRIDLLTTVKGVASTDVYARRARVRHGEVAMNLISFQDLIKSKASSDRAKDLADVDELRKVKAAGHRSRKAATRGTRKQTRRK